MSVTKCGVTDWKSLNIFSLLWVIISRVEVAFCQQNAGGAMHSNHIQKRPASSKRMRAMNEISYQPRRHLAYSVLPRVIRPQKPSVLSYVDARIEAM